MCEWGANSNPWAGYRIGPSRPPRSPNSQTGGMGVEKSPFEIAAKSANHRLSTSCVVVEQFDHYCGDDLVAPWPRKLGAKMDLPSSTGYVDGWCNFLVIGTSMHYINGWCRIIVAINSPMRVDARSCINIFGTSDSKYYRATSCFALPHQLV